MTTNRQSGQVSWSDENTFGSEKKEVNKDQFLRLEEGSNVIRILTDPFQYLTHKGIKKVGDPGFGRKVYCSKETGSCTLCDQGFAISPRYFLGVLHRKSNSYKVLDLSWSTLQDVKSYVGNPVWGAVQTYDLDIIRDSKSKTKYYRIQPLPHKPLSAADEKVRDDNMDLEELKRKTEPLAAEIVEKIVAKIVGDGTLQPPPPNEKKADMMKSANGVKTTVKAKVTVEDEDTTDIFPEYNSEASNG